MELEGTPSTSIGKDEVFGSVPGSVPRVASPVFEDVVPPLVFKSESLPGKAYVFRGGEQANGQMEAWGS